MIRRSLLLVGLACVLAHARSPAEPAPQQSADRPKKLALLVGCTDYPFFKAVPPLHGPANDVKLLCGLLQTRFGFAKENITTLAGYSKDDAHKDSRPTYDNIRAAFLRLIEAADEQTQIVILLSGHGTQLPIPETQTDPLDPKNPEPDGMDEVFLPCDVRSDGKGGLVNHLLDDEIGEWLDRLSARGAAVWILFDCCHSGTMDRGGFDPADRERPREVLPERLGVDPKKIDAAKERAAAAVEKAGVRGVEQGALPLSADKRRKGPVVAFYAAQSYEKAPETVLPEDAPTTPDNYYGLLTWNVVKLLQQTPEALTYRELAQLLAAQYAADRGLRPPTPFADGDVDFDVLGTRKWPGRATLLLTRDDDQLGVTGGVLQGITPGSVLAVGTPAGQEPRNLGHIKVKAATPGRARVEPCAFAAVKAPLATDLPDGGRCELVYRNVGDVRVRLAVAKAAIDADAKLLAAVRDALDDDARALVEFVTDETRAEWILALHKKQLVLRKAEGIPVASVPLEPGARAAMPALFRVCAVDDADKMAEALRRDLQRIFTWQTLWRAGGAAGSGKEARNLKLVMTVEQVQYDPKTKKVVKSLGELGAGATLLPGDAIRLTLENKGFLDAWVVVCLMEGNCAVTPLQTLRIPARDRFVSGALVMNGRTWGKEGIIAIAGPLGGGKTEMDLAFLRQRGLEDAERDAPVKVPKQQTPFGRLLATAKLGRGDPGYEVQDADNPAVLTWSCVTLPLKQSLKQ